MGNQKRSVYISKQRLKSLLKEKKLTKKQLAHDLTEKFYKFGTEAKVKKIMENQLIQNDDLINMAKFFDAHPGYLDGTINEKPEEVCPLLFSIPEEEFCSRFRCSHEEYTAMKAAYRIDDLGFFVPPFRDYIYEQKRNLNFQDFKNWLLSIKLYGNPDIMESFPTSEKLENILSSMDESELQAFQDFTVEFVENYLRDNGYLPPLESMTDDEMTDNYRKNMQEGNELYKRRKGDN